MNWLLLAIGALLCFVVYDTAGRYLATKAKDPKVFAVIYNSTVALMSPALFLFDKTLPAGLNLKVIGLTILGLSIWALFGRFEFFARKHSEVSTFTIIIKLAPVANFFLALVVFRESWTIHKLVGIGLIAFANILLFLNNKRSDVISDKGLKYVLFVALMLALGWIFDAMNISYWGVATFSFLSFAAPALLSSVLPFVKLKEIKQELRLSPLWQIALLGFFNMIGYGLMLKALTLAEASKVMPIVTSTAPFVILLGIFALGERDFMGRKLFAGVMTVVAVYLLR